jgi:hypothetical protein
MKKRLMGFSKKLPFGEDIFQFAERLIIVDRLAQLKFASTLVLKLQYVVTPLALKFDQISDLPCAGENYVLDK